MTTQLSGREGETVSVSPAAHGAPSSIILGACVGGGGEGRVYLSSDRRFAVKLYSSRVASNKVAMLERVMVAGARLDPQRARHFVWPIGIVRSVSGTPSVGCVMKAIPSTSVPLLDLVFSMGVAIRQFRQGHQWASYLRVARDLAVGMRILHGMGGAHADPSLRNFHADLSTGEAVLLDLDGLVVDGTPLRPQVAGTRGSRAPELERGVAEPSFRTDLHSLAILILQTLLFRNPLQPLICYDELDEVDERIGWGDRAVFSEHPTDLRHRPQKLGQPPFVVNGGALSYRMLPPALQRLTELALVDGLTDPSARPLAQQWDEGLGAALDQLTRCGTCGQSIPYPFWVQPRSARRCPLCGGAIPAPYPAVVELLEPRARGIYQPSRRLVLGHGQQILSDAIVVGPIRRDAIRPVGRVLWHKGAQVLALMNDDERGWTAIRPAGRGAVPVPRGAAVPLEPGLHVDTGSSRRLLRVIE